MIEGTAAHLVIDDVTVTGRFKRAIRDAITLPPLASTKVMEGQSHSSLINKRLRYVARVDEVPHRGIFREDGNCSKIFGFQQQAAQIMWEKFAHSF